MLCILWPGWVIWNTTVRTCTGTIIISASLSLTYISHASAQKHSAKADSHLLTCSSHILSVPTASLPLPGPWTFVLCSVSLWEATNKQEEENQDMSSVNKFVT